jgi:hypothetical protein
VSLSIVLYIYHTKASAVSVRAYGAEKDFIEESHRRIDRHTRAARTFFNLNRWITIRVDAIGGIFTASLAAYLVYFQSQTASNTGFSLNMAGVCVIFGVRPGKLTDVDSRV